MTKGDLQAALTGPGGGVVDALGRTVALAGPARRVVSLVPSLTELLFALGAGERVAGVSDYCLPPERSEQRPAGGRDCLHPAEGLAGRPRVGGQKDPDLGRLRALAPDLVLCAKEENLRRDVEALERTGVPVYVTDVRTITDALALPGQLGPLCGADPEAVALVAAEMARGVEEARALARSRPRRRLIVPVWREPWIVAAGDTYIDAVLDLIGADNVAVGLEVRGGSPGSRRDASPRGRKEGSPRYPKADAAALRALGAERILLPSEPYPFTAAHLDEAALELGAQAVLCDGTVLCWYGPRMARLPELARLL